MRWVELDWVRYVISTIYLHRSNKNHKIISSMQWLSCHLLLHSVGGRLSRLVKSSFSFCVSRGGTVSQLMGLIESDQGKWTDRHLWSQHYRQTVWGHSELVGRCWPTASTSWQKERADRWLAWACRSAVDKRRNFYLHADELQWWRHCHQRWSTDLVTRHVCIWLRCSWSHLIFLCCWTSINLLTTITTNHTC